MSKRLIVVKSILWALVGVLAAVTAARFINGLGAVTALSDATPWGLWIAFDVMAGVALAAGGFILAATVYIFGLQRYRPFVRPAILTAFLGYAAVATALLYDLGLPWRIWHPIIFPQVHSVLFEVAMCVMLYLTVLGLEFAPVALEHSLFGRPFFQGVLKILKKATIPLVIAGIILSTLHQSSLGSLFLIAPFRVHPLWHSPIIDVLFLVSAVGLGLMMVTVESVLSAWLFDHRTRPDLLSNLGAAGAAALGFYAVLRLGDLAARGVIGQAFNGSWQGLLFLFELLVSAILPAVLLSQRRVRGSLGGLALCAAMVVFGMILYRLDVSVVTFARPAGMSYFPMWEELAVSLGIAAGAALIFIFFIENLKVYEDMEHGEAGGRAARKPSFDPAALNVLTPWSLGAPRIYSLVAVTAAALAVGLLPAEAIFGPRPKPTPVARVRTVEAFEQKRPTEGTGADFVLAGLAKRNAAPDAKRVAVMVIDGNRDGRLVPFTHEEHVAELGGESSCGQCHHQNEPFDQNTPCAQCHRDLYEPSDIFDHSRHIRKLNGNHGCAECHANSSGPKTRQTATACADCHADMAVADSRIASPAGGTKGMAPGYMDAMHGLCIGCHEDEAKKKNDSAFARCDLCHGEMGGSDFLQAPPYVRRTPGEEKAGPVQAALATGTGQ